jgi:hypothetical protein
MKRANELSDEELQVVIAEDQGYHPHPDNHTKDQKWWSYGGEGYGLPNGVPKKICVMPPLNGGMWPDIGPLPNYPGDLNAMHNAENLVIRPQRLWYQYCLKLPGRSFDESIGATARQRAEAYVIVRKLALP